MKFNLIVIIISGFKIKNFTNFNYTTHWACVLENNKMSSLKVGYLFQCKIHIFLL